MRASECSGLCRYDHLVSLSSSTFFWDFTACFPKKEGEKKTQRKPPKNQNFIRLLSSILKARQASEIYTTFFLIYYFFFGIFAQCKHDKWILKDSIK
jgi:hypothetical protein